MEYLNEGFYYKVYEAVGNRVFKKLQPCWFSFKKIFRHNRQNNKSVFSALLGAYRSCIRERRALYAMKEKLKTLPLAWFANPVFEMKLDYTQDKVVIIEEFLKNAAMERGKEVVDKYIELRREFWQHGIHDKTYKFPTNFGVDKNGSVVCIDFGEFVFTKEEALQSVLARKWLIRYGYKRWPDGPVKEHYTRQMDEVMKEKVLNEYWNTKKISR